MGQEIVYCYSCQTRLMAADFDRGKAFRFEDRVACAECAKGYLEALPADQRPKPVGRSPDAPLSSATPRRGTRALSGATPQPGSVRSLSGNTPRSGTARVVSVEPERKSKLPVFLAGGGLLAGVILLVVLMSGGGEDPAPEKTAALPPPTPPPKPKVIPVRDDPRLVQAREAYARASKLPPTTSLEERIRAYDAAIKAASGTPYHAKAVEAHSALVAQRSKILEQDFEAVKDQVRPHLTARRFKQARDLFQDARTRHRLADWTARIDRSVAELDAEVARLYAPLRLQAGEAKAQGDLEAVKKVRASVARWGVARYLSDLDTFLAAIEMPKPESPQLAAYRAAWKSALLSLAAGEDDAALKNLEAEAKKVTDPELAKEAASDLQDLRRLRAVQAEALKRVANLAPGKALILEVRDDKGGRQKRSGTLVEAGSVRLRLVDAEGKPVIVELEDLTASALAEGDLKGFSDDDRRVLALGCLIEGSEEGARKILFGSSARVPAKYGAFVAETEVKLKPVPAREMEARKLFHAAEREFADTETLLGAVEKYIALRDEYGDTNLVRSARERIEKRATTGTEYFLIADDMEGNGTFRRERREDGQVWWLNAREAGESLDNHVAFGFAAMPDRVYRCWVYAGACCAETFVVRYQATGMTGPDPARRTRKVPIDPGSEHSAEVRHGIRYLKRTHAAHGGPKEPAKWAWFPLKLPMEPAPGPFAIRLISHQKGFAVGAVCISSTRTNAPSEEETAAELAKAKSRPDPEIVTEGLIGHWKFDDGSGDTALDSVNASQTGQLKGDPEWTEGVHGGALKFDGDEDYVELPVTPALKELERGSYTIAAWFKPEDTPPEKGDENKSAYGIIVKAGYHLGLIYSNEQRFLMDHWFAEGHGMAGTWNDTYAPARYYHVVGVVDPKAGATMIYVDGKKMSTFEWDEPGKAARDYGASTWKIGIGAPGGGLWGWPAKGWIDDVRFYNRALTVEEVGQLTAAGLKAQSKD